MDQSPRIASVTHFLHSKFVPLLLISYVFAALAPQLGLLMRSTNFGTLDLPGLGATKVTLALVMLSFLLFNAGLGIKTSELAGLRAKPQLLIAGFLANLLVPIFLVFCCSGLFSLWHNSEELQSLLVGLALIIAMPIAGSSAAWAQNANGNLSLSLGLVLSSTILSPITTPLVLNSFAFLTQGDYSSDLQELSQQGTNAFLCLTVVGPSLLGILVHTLLGEKRTQAIKPYMKCANFVVLLLLNYSNAATSLPQAVAHPDWDLLALIAAVTLAICLIAFLTGWLIAKFFRADNADKAALMFSLGMNNNGTGLVLAATALADHPAVLLPMIFYTLGQQFVAAMVDKTVFAVQRQA